MADPYRLVDQCVCTGLTYLADSLQYYWPANFAILNGVQQAYLNDIAERNITLHMAHSFAEKGFHMWAEVPLKDESRKIDFLAFNYSEGIMVSLEFKNSLDYPPKNYADLERLVAIHQSGLCNPKHGFNKQSVECAEHRMYGIVTLFSPVEFADWWLYPGDGENYMPKDRRGGDYKKIGKAVEKASYSAVVPLAELIYQGGSSELRYRFLRAAYALYDEKSISELKKVLDAS
jgi:hypothetical protein